ncbi:thymidylate synthase [Larkinella punicea]|uniref:Thymidylate synthase n=1 Tax=Larkinella punicea TaxID=2315727 RepID=A0A368JN03_9BACT|nr:thymidylate synthase [Larkinella punicea]RCR67521.1 thymidylate synthase [Larkinella punicea]
MYTTPLLLEGTNLSIVWCRAVDHILQNSGADITPLVVTLTKFEESIEVRNMLEQSLRINEKSSINTVAETIFPESLYQLYSYDRHALYEGYLSILPRLKKIDPKNAKGTYFERLIAFNGKINQLEMIINSLQEEQSVRRSKLQASIFDATRDHSDSPYQRFPCLQHVTFNETPSRGLIINSFYAMQYLYERAYGNWLGLINLGKFVARELNLNFERLNCFVGVEHLDISKEKAKKLRMEFNQLSIYE